jgi:hypothetical protein
MGDVIRLRVPDSRYRAACSADSTGPPKQKLASVVRLRLRHPKILAGCARAETTLRRSGTQHPDRAQDPPVSPRFQICPEALAFPRSIMDDKSMQSWTNAQLTPGASHRTIVSVGRPTRETTPAAYRTAFIKRVRTARALYTDSPPEMAKALGVERDTYYRYEKRLMLPHHLIPTFCAITGVPLEWLLKGPTQVQSDQVPRAATGTERR